MGAWSNKPFGNDTALDWLAGLEDSKSCVKKIKNSFTTAINSDDLDASVAEEAVAAAAVVAAGSLEKISGIYKDAKQWIERAAFSPNRELKQLAIASLTRITTDSELRDLWEEAGKLSGWAKEIDKISSILEQYLDEDPPKRVAKKQRLPRSIGKLADLYMTSKDPNVKGKLVEKLLDVEDPNAQESNTDFDLPLNIAAKAGLTTAVSALIKMGADVNTCSRYGYKPLPLACAKGHVEVAKILLESGANLFENYPMYDDKGNVVEVRKVCIAILSCSRYGTPELIQLLVDHGADIQETDLNGETLLHKAAEFGNHKMIDYLVSSGLDVNKHKGLINTNERSQGESPLHYAVQRKQFLAAKTLIEHGANVNALEYFIGTGHTWFHTPLDLVSKDGYPELYELLESKGALKSRDMSEPDKLLKLTPGGVI